MKLVDIREEADRKTLKWTNASAVLAWNGTNVQVVHGVGRMTLEVRNGRK